MAHNSEALVRFGNGGWAKLYSDDATAFVRVDEIEGRLRVTELYVPTDSGLNLAALQRLPIADFEAMVNTLEPDHEFLKRRNHPGPDLRTASAFYATGVQKLRENHWPTLMLLSQYDESGLPAANPPADGFDGQMTLLSADVVDSTLDVPSSKPYGNEFFHNVASVYRALIRSGVRSPGQAIAAANGVPISSAHGWIKQARQRGFLPPGAKGKTG